MSAKPTPILPKWPQAKLWMTKESHYRLLVKGGNNKGAVPVHGKPSKTAVLPLFTEAQMVEYGKKCAALALAKGE